MSDTPADQPIEQSTGRFICSPEHPMPRGAAGRWAHQGTKSDGECSEGCCDYYICVDCNHRWREEVAQ